MAVYRKTSLILPICFALTASPCQAFFHLWDFTEFFSNADGSVQFIELHTVSNGEHSASDIQIRSQAMENVFTFPSDLSSSATAGKSLLIATPGFGALPGAVEPDFVLPTTSFFNPAGDTISHTASSAATTTFSSLPTDGLMSRHYPANTLGLNSPRNFAGAEGSLDLSPPAMPTGDYNGNGTVDAADYVVWRDTLGQTVPAGQRADGDQSAAVDAADYTFWRARFGSTVNSSIGGTAATVPESASIVLLLSALFLSLWRSRQRADRSARSASGVALPWKVHGRV